MRKHFCSFNWNQFELDQTWGSNKSQLVGFVNFIFLFLHFSCFCCHRFLCHCWFFVVVVVAVIAAVLLWEFLGFFNAYQCKRHTQSSTCACACACVYVCVSVHIVFIWQNTLAKLSPSTVHPPARPPACSICCWRNQSFFLLLLLKRYLLNNNTAELFRRALFKGSYFIHKCSLNNAQWCQMHFP